jgi:hypothetical protein
MFDQEKDNKLKQQTKTKTTKITNKNNKLKQQTKTTNKNNK